jgi:putative ABC transport system ATP-binding protein
MIELKDVKKVFSGPAGDFHALRGVNLSIGAGALTAIVGKSGSGKSTLLNMVGGIDRPSSGSVAVAGERLDPLTESSLSSWRGRMVGFVFQFFQLLPTLTALENVTLPMDFARIIPARERRRRAEVLLARMDMSRHAGKLPSALSGGEQQRVAIARALANDPLLILADEPTGNLDKATAASVRAVLRSLAAEGKTVVVVTHDPDFGKDADQVIEISDGLVLADSAAGARRVEA